MKIIAIVALLFVFPVQCLALNVGVVSDMHSGKDKKRTAGSNITYPKKAEGFFKTALKSLKVQGAEVVIALGDNANKGQVKYYKKLKKAANKYGLPVIWVKGNHDSDHFRYLHGSSNYATDFGDVRIIALDSNFANKSANGQITPEGQALYQEASQTDKKVVVVMHHPPYFKYTCDWNPVYNLVQDADVILAGHWHRSTQCGENRMFTALTENRKPNYTMISL